MSKAAERSNKRRIEMLSLSRAERISFTMRMRVLSLYRNRRVLPRPCGACRLTWTGVCYRDLAGLVASPEQACVLHEVLLELEPGHWLPPCCAAGLSQARVRDLLPLPQARLHVPHAPQEPHAPFTERQRRAQLAIFTPSTISTQCVVPVKPYVLAQASASPDTVNRTRAVNGRPSLFTCQIH